jgi:hypothetical protein
MASSDIIAAGAETAAAVISTSGALLGVVLGGLFTVVVDSFRRGRSEARLERAAGRLLSTELAQSRENLSYIAERRIVRREDLPDVVPSWDQYRELLASRMDQESWETCAHAVSSVRRICGLLEPFAASETGSGELPRHLVGLLAEVSAVMEPASRLLDNGRPTVTRSPALHRQGGGDAPTRAG